jgi:hypothetical protein
MNAEAEATEAWVSVTAGSFDPKTLGAPEKNRQYLENRLVRAFQQGMDAGRKIESAETKHRIITLLFPKT